MPRFAFNGGVSGIRRVPTTSAATGIWDLHQQNEAKRAGIWPQPGGDPNFSSVSLLLHMNGSNGSTTFTDSSSNALTVTASGNAQISTAQSKFGGASGLFDGSGDYLSLSTASALGMGSGDFTIEYFVRFTASGTQVHLDQRGSGTALYIYSSGTTLYFADDVANRITGTSALTADTWHHIAVSKSGSSTKLFVDGTQVGSTYTDSTDYGASKPLYIATYYQASAVFLNGNIDELRITKGVARYTANFTAPTAAFPDY